MWDDNVITGSTNYSLFYIMPTDDESDFNYKRYYQEGKGVNLFHNWSWILVHCVVTESYKGGLTYA